MRIDGKQIAQGILDSLKEKASKLHSKPHLAIILVGDDPASASYVNQKVKKAEQIGCKSTVYRLPITVSENELLATIEQLNNDSNVNGIIVQRPLPNHIDSKKVDELTSPEKDIDGFNSQSQFEPPLPLAVIEILINIFEQEEGVTRQGDPRRAPAMNEVNEDVGRGKAAAGPRIFENWLKKQGIVIIGKGETGGGPIIQYLNSLNVHTQVIDSKTTNSEQITQNADIIITTVGKQNLINKSNIKPGAILIGVGMSKGTDGKLHGDYDEDEIKNIASFYTPIPGGVGPVNVAMLLSNLFS